MLFTIQNWTFEKSQQKERLNIIRDSLKDDWTSKI